MSLVQFCLYPPKHSNPSESNEIPGDFHVRLTGFDVRFRQMQAYREFGAGESGPCPWGVEIPDANNYVIRLGSAPTPYVPWQDEGEILRGIPHADKRISWVGGGAAPLQIAEGKYFVLYHNGAFFHDDYRWYEGCACLMDLDAYVPDQPERIVSHRIEPFMAPATEQEANEAKRISIIFPMHAHLYDGKLYFLYGSGDRGTCGACVDWQEVRDAMGF